MADVPKDIMEAGETVEVLRALVEPFGPRLYPADHVVSRARRLIEALLSERERRTAQGVGNVVEPLDLKTIAYNAGLEIRHAIAASGVDPIQHIPEVDAIIERRLSEAFDRAAQIARNRAKGNERLAMSHPEGSDGRRLAVERCKEADQITFAIEAERIRQAGKDGGAG